MPSKERVLFIVNPTAHGLKGQDIHSLIREEIDHQRFDYEISFQMRSIDDFTIVAAVGGDGTVNQVARLLIHTKSALAVIPAGSGNGFAGHLRIPLDLRASIRALNQAQKITIDTAEINGKPFVGVAGIGFDALVADRFASFGKRGLLSYMQVILQEYFGYQPQTYRFKIKDQWLEREALQICFANGSQYGNQFQIAPNAAMQDGLLEVVIVKPSPLWQIPQQLFQSRRGSYHAETFRCRAVQVDINGCLVHLDGEPVNLEGPLSIQIVPRSLSVMVKLRVADLSVLNKE